jgi:hypothetical protein
MSWTADDPLRDVLIGPFATASKQRDAPNAAEFRLAAFEASRCLLAWPAGSESDSSADAGTVWRTARALHPLGREVDVASSNLARLADSLSLAERRSSRKQGWIWLDIDA